MVSELRRYKMEQSQAGFLLLTHRSHFDTTNISSTPSQAGGNGVAQRNVNAHTHTHTRTNICESMKSPERRANSMQLPQRHKHINLYPTFTSERRESNAPTLHNKERERVKLEHKESLSDRSSFIRRLLSDITFCLQRKKK